MADSLCGPSNSLEAFKKHTSVNRTLQQDRAGAGQSSAEVSTIIAHSFVNGFRFINVVLQGFRSSSAAAGVLDAEFDAFQFGHPLQPGGIEHEITFPTRLIDSFESEHLQLEPATWATDFQRLQLTNAQAGAIAQSQSREQISVHPEFEAYKAFKLQEAQSFHLRYNKNRMIGSRLYNKTHFETQNESNNTPFQNLQSNQDLKNIDVLDEEALERAFDAASHDLRDLEEHAQKENTRYEQNISIDDKVEGSSLEDEGPSLYDPIGSDRIIITSPMMIEPPYEGSEDQLARTAGELLDNVKHEDSEKFQQSNFLSLMRQLRDREVRIEGDKVVDVSIASPILE